MLKYLEFKAKIILRTPKIRLSVPTQVFMLKPKTKQNKTKKKTLHLEYISISLTLNVSIKHKAKSVTLPEMIFSTQASHRSQHNILTYREIIFLNLKS